MKKRLLKLKKNKRLLLVLSIVVIGVLYATGVIFPRNNGEGIKTTTAQYKDLTVSVSSSGSVFSDKDSKAFFGAFGKVGELKVKKGDKVEKGQVLATLDTVSLYNSYVAANETYRATLASNDSAVETRREWLETNQDEEFTDIIRAQRFQGDAAVRKASANVEVAKANAAVAQDALSKAYLTSPIDGTVLEINNIEQGLNTTAITNSYIRVADTNELKFVAYVDEVDLGDINSGQEVSVELDAYRDELFEGTVFYIYDFAEKTGAGSMVVPVEVNFTQPTDKIKVGLGGDADFVMERKENVLVIPKKALINGGDTPIVRVMDESGKIEKRDVTVGLRNTKHVEITEGLTEGDKVVTSKIEDE